MKYLVKFAKIDKRDKVLALGNDVEKSLKKLLNNVYVLPRRSVFADGRFDKVVIGAKLSSSNLKIAYSVLKIGGKLVVKSKTLAGMLKRLKDSGFDPVFSDSNVVRRVKTYYIVGIKK